MDSIAQISVKSTFQSPENSFILRGNHYENYYMANPRVFISYSWDSEDHRGWALMLANRLVENGVDVQFDQYDIQLGRNITQKMEQNVTHVDKVVLIFTENYKKKAEDREGGVGFEYSMISAEWYRKQDKNVKFIPILRSGTEETSIPSFVKNYLYADMREGKNFEKAFEDLLRTIYGEPRVPKPPLGKKPDFSRKNEFTTLPAEASSGPIPDATEKNIIQSNDIYAIKKHLQMLIATNETKEVIDQLLELADLRKDSRLQSSIILQSGRYHSMREDSRKGIMTESSRSVTTARIQDALLSLIEGLK